MVRKLNRQYLLTHHPLLWNTNAVWVLIANLMIHGFFAVAGFGSIESGEMNRYRSEWDVANGNLYIFSTLCSLVVLITWLIFFLRNNAFKNFYRIDKWYLAKEFLIILLICVTTIFYFKSFHYGVRLKVRTITDRNLFIKEVNSVNRAMAFLPMDRSDYFIKNTCEERGNSNEIYLENINYGDTTSTGYNDSSNAAIREALRQANAFSYANYCKLALDEIRDAGVLTAQQIAEETKKILKESNRHEVSSRISELVRICRKYGIQYKMDEQRFASLPFADSLHTVSRYLAHSFYASNESQHGDHPNYIDIYDLRGTANFIARSFPLSGWDADDNLLLILAYISLTVAVLILCYRRFPKRIFLISTVGTLVWSILIGLISFGAESIFSFALLCNLLCVAFLGVSLFNLKNGIAKTITGVLLNWHIYLLPYFILLLMLLIGSYYDQIHIPENYNFDHVAYMKKHHAFTYWVKEHASEISIANFFFSIAYITFLFNRLTLQHHSMPAE